MKNFMVACLIGICIAFFRAGHDFWGFIILGVILMFLPDGKDYKSDLIWMSEALMDEGTLKQKKDSANRYRFVIGKMADGEIRKDMSVEEVKSVLGKMWDYILLGQADSKKGANVQFYGYGQGLPTPILTLKFQQGKLVDYNLSNHNDAELRHGFHGKNMK